jgi:hypothetical protein
VDEFSEDRNKLVLRVDIHAEFVRAASEVLHDIIRLNDRDSRSVSRFLYEQSSNWFVARLSDCRE